MTEYDVIVLTDHRYLEDSDESYKHNVFYEDSLVVNALKNEGLRVNRKSWDDKNFDWSSSKYLLFRTTWDYFDRLEEFLNWIERVSHKTRFINSLELFHWNIDKHYLKELHKKGVNIPDTYFIEKGAEESLADIHKKLSWKETVLKPCISGAARHTYKLSPETISDHEAIFKKLIENESFLLQPFQDNIVSEGEISLMLFNGEYTHAVLKKAKAGDFRVQDDFGGTVHNYSANAQEIEFAVKSVNACPEVPMYARVDIIKDNNGDLAVSELELIEPELWFREYPPAAVQLAKAVKHKKLRNYK